MSGNQELFKCFDCLSVICLFVCLSVRSFVRPFLYFVLSFFLALFLLSCILLFFLLFFLALCLAFFLSFFLFLVSNFPYILKCQHFSGSRNSRRERELFVVPENRWREGFGNCFHENLTVCLSSVYLSVCLSVRLFVRYFILFFLSF